MNSKTVHDFMHLKEFDSDRLADIVRGGRFEHFILVPSKCEVRHHRWIRHTFSVDVGHYSFATRAAGRFPKNRVCVGYMRSVTEPTWVNGFEFGTDLIQYYPPGTEVNYRAGPNGEWALIQLDQPFNSRHLSAALGLTERTLQNYFLDAYGLTPGRWARCLALRQVRKRLISGENEKLTIEGIARESGFRHMGRFARHYAELFDESPSASHLRVNACTK